MCKTGCYFELIDTGFSSSYKKIRTSFYFVLYGQFFLTNESEIVISFSMNDTKIFELANKIYGSGEIPDLMKKAHFIVIKKERVLSHSSLTGVK